MSRVVLRIRLVSGEHTDVQYDAGKDVDDEEAVVENVVTILAREDGVLRCRHGERSIAIFSRGVATVEVAPRGAVL
jgi:hypothetical protein